MDDNLIILGEPRPQRADAVKNRALLLDTAQRLFEQQGVETVTMSAVAEAAGVGKGTLYRHFKDKVQLCEELLDMDQRDLQERTLQRLRFGGNPAESLLWFLDEALSFVERNRHLLPVGVSMSMLGHPAHLWWRMTIRGLLTSAGVTGDVDYASDQLYVMLDMNTIEFQRVTLGYDMERIRLGIAEAARRVLMNIE